MLFDRLMRRRGGEGRFGRLRNGAVSWGATSCLQPLGVGGMAQVFKARAVGPGGFRRDVVVKRILPEYGRDSEFIRMFVDEAKLLGLLHHPNVVQVYDFGEDDGVLYLALEYVEGPSLSRVLRTLRGANKRMPPAIVAFVAREICRALECVHELRDEQGRPLGAIDRDVTPSNVILTPAGEVKLLDFGVATFKHALQADEIGNGQRQARLSGARAARRQSDRRARRPVRARHRHARDADASASVCGGQRSRHGQADHGDGDSLAVCESK